jgi:hypothetical protein
VQELIVIVAGFGLGVAAAPIASRLRLALVLVIGAAIIGPAVSRLAGEAEAFAAWDVAQALVASVAAVTLVRRMAARGRPSSR